MHVCVHRGCHGYAVRSGASDVRGKREVRLVEEHSPVRSWCVDVYARLVTHLIGLEFPHSCCLLCSFARLNIRAHEAIARPLPVISWDFEGFYAIPSIVALCNRSRLIRDSFLCVSLDRFPLFPPAATNCSEQYDAAAFTCPGTNTGPARTLQCHLGSPTTPADACTPQRCCLPLSACNALNDPAVQCPTPATVPKDIDPNNVPFCNPTVNGDVCCLRSCVDSVTD